jgi:hypothetical protein
MTLHSSETQEEIMSTKHRCVIHCSSYHSYPGVFNRDKKKIAHTLKVNAKPIFVQTKHVTIVSLRLI